MLKMLRNISQESLSNITDKGNFINVKTALLFDETTDGLIIKLNDYEKNGETSLSKVKSYLMLSQDNRHTDLANPQINMPIEKHAAYLYSHIYALPYSINDNKSDGIARYYHGISHTARAAFYIPILANLFRKHRDAEALNLTNEDLHLIQIATLLHDSGRESEGKDYWDKDSGTMVYCYLIKLGVPIDKAKKLAEATANKDAKNHYHELITENDQVKWIKSDVRPKNIYQKLIHDADCLDIIRVRDKFEAEYLDFYQYIVQKNMNHSDDTSLDEMANLICETRCLIDETGDNYHRPKPEIKKTHETCNIYNLILSHVNIQNYPVFSTLYAQGKLIQQEDLNKISIIETKPYDAKLAFNNNSLNSAFKTGKVFARSITKPSAISDKKLPTPDGNEDETYAHLELRKTARRIGIKTPTKKDDNVNKQGNPNRSISLLGFGGGVFSSAGFIIINPNISHIGNIYEENAGTGFGKKKYFKPDNLTDEQKLKKLNDLLLRLKLGGTGDTYSQVEITYLLEDYDAIFFSHDPARGNQYTSGSDDAPHVFSPILQAIYLQKEYANMHGGKILPIINYSGLHNYIKLIDSTEYTDDKIADMWATMCADFINNEVSQNNMSLSTLCEFFNSDKALENLKINAMYGKGHTSGHFLPADKLFGKSLQDKINNRILNKLDDAIVKLLNCSSNKYMDIAILYLAMSRSKVEVNCGWLRRVIVVDSDIINVLQNLNSSFQKSFLLQLGIPYLVKLTNNFSREDILNSLDIQDADEIQNKLTKFEHEERKQYQLLVAAIKEDNEDHVISLLKNNPLLIKMSDDYGFQPLHFASMSGQVNIVNILVNFGADINCKNIFNDTPLHWAAWSGNIDLVKYYLNNKCDPNAVNLKNRSALSGAIQFGYPDIVKILSDYDHSLNKENLLIPSVNMFKRFVCDGEIDKIEELLKSAKIRKRDYLDAILHLDIANEIDFKTFNYLMNKVGPLSYYPGDTNWVYQCIKKNFSCINTFVKHGFKIDKPNYFGTILDLAIEDMDNLTNDNFDLSLKILNQMQSGKEAIMPMSEIIEKLVLKIEKFSDRLNDQFVPKYLSKMFQYFGQYIIEYYPDGLKLFINRLTNINFTSLNAAKLDKKQISNLFEAISNMSLSEPDINANIAIKNKDSILDFLNNAINNMSNDESDKKPKSSYARLFSALNENEAENSNSQQINQTKKIKL